MKLKSLYVKTITIILLSLTILSIALIASNSKDKIKEKEDVKTIKKIKKVLALLKSKKIDKEKAINELKKAVNKLEGDSSNPIEGNLNNNYFFQNIDPFKDMQKMEEQMNKMFKQSAGTQNFGFNGTQSLFLNMNGMNSININTEEKDNYFLVKIKAPNIKESNIKVTLEDNILKISGRIIKNEQKKDKNGNIIYTQQYSSNFNRSFELNSPVKNSGMTTTFKKDILEVKILKK